MADATAGDGQSLGYEQRPLEREDGIAAELAACGNHPVIGNSRVVGLPEDVADRARGTGPAGQSRDVAIGGDAPDRNAPDDGEDPPGEGTLSGRH